MEDLVQYMIFKRSLRAGVPLLLAEAALKCMEVTDTFGNKTYKVRATSRASVNFAAIA
jgi:hypothetical protein